MQLTRCARPTLTSRRISTYTIMGFAGYAAANVVGIVLARLWDLTLLERLVGFFAPGLAFIVVVTIASAIVGRERIVFYRHRVLRRAWTSHRNLCPGLLRRALRTRARAR